MSDLFRVHHLDRTTREERIRRFCEECISVIPEKNLSDGLTLEIGCGHGHWLTAYSETLPNEPCIGIDLITKRIEKSNIKKTKRKLPFLFFFKTEAVEFLRCLPETIRIKRSIILFPDPWPKKRHHKRRLIQRPFLDLLAARSVPNAELCFRTDHQDYFSWSVDQVNGADSWHIDPDAVWPFEHETFFQNILPEYQTFIASHHYNPF